MAFFGNDAVNRVNAHYAIQAFAMGAGGIFFLAFLISAGLSVAAALATMGAWLAGRFVLRALVLPLGKRWGMKPLVIAGALVIAAQYPMLAEVRGVNAWLVAVCVAAALGDSLYWSSYHAWFAALGDAEHRGHQVGAREAIATLVGIVAPAIGGWALATLGPRWAFWSVAAVQALSVWPLIFAPNVPVKPDAPEAFRTARFAVAFFISDGWLAATYYIVFEIVLFLSLGRSFVAYGLAMAVAQLVGAAVTAALGRHIDRGGGRRAALVAYGVTAAVVVLRAVSQGSPALAVAGIIAGALVNALVLPVGMTAAYNMAKASPCPLRFEIVAEGGWDLGCSGGVLTAAAIAAAGLPLGFSILLALPATAYLMRRLSRYYAASAVGAAPAQAGEAI